MKEEGRERLGKFSVKSKEAVKSEGEARQVRPEAVAYRTQEAGGRLKAVRITAGRLQ